MSYFKKFPNYLTKTLDKKQIVIQDFFKRIRIKQEPKNLTSILLPYIVLDGETPEMISSKFYGTPFYHWVLLIVNDIVDPRKEWPLESRYVLTLVFDKYDFIIEVPDISQYNIGDILQSTEGAKFVVMNVGDETISIRSTTGYTTLSISESTLSNLTSEVTGLSILDVTDPTEGIHHYQDITTGLIVDFSNNPDIVPVTNLQFEEQVNEDKRKIRLLDPAFIQPFVRNFDTEINE